MNYTKFKKHGSFSALIYPQTPNTTASYVLFSSAAHRPLLHGTVLPTLSPDRQCRGPHKQEANVPDWVEGVSSSVDCQTPQVPQLSFLNHLCFPSFCCRSCTCLVFLWEVQTKLCAWASFGSNVYFCFTVYIMFFCMFNYSFSWINTSFCNIIFILKLFFLHIFLRSYYTDVCIRLCGYVDVSGVLLEARRRHQISWSTDCCEPSKMDLRAWTMKPSLQSLKIILWKLMRLLTG